MPKFPLRVAIATALNLTAWVLPWCLQLYNHNPPVGTYIALAGLAMAVTTFRNAPATAEKLFWIALVTGLTFGEIRNLYVADRQQTETFSRIQSKLNETKVGLDITLGNLRSDTKTLQGLSHDINDARKRSETQFENTLSRINEAIKMETGGNSVCYLAPLGPTERHLRVTIFTKGKYPLYGVSMRVADRTYMQQTQDVMGATLLVDKIGDIPTTESGMLTDKEITFKIPGQRQALNIFFNAKNGWWTELFRLVEVKGTWQHAIMVIRHNISYTSVAIVKIEVSPDYPRSQLAADTEWQSLVKRDKTPHARVHLDASMR